MKLIESSEGPSNLSGKLGGAVPQLFVEHLNYVILFSTDNCPFEEGLVIQLLSRQGQELERIELYDEYAPAQFNLVAVGQDELKFTFWSDDHLILRYSDDKRRVLIAPSGIHYSKRLAARHLIVERLG